jgi:hypothetical protein
MTRAPMPTDSSLPRPDPRANAFPGQELVYQSIQRLWSAWARRRYRDEFDRVTSFCLFLGYPRSGHSVVGAMLNAHRHAVISHELDAPRLILAGCDRDELYARILARAAWFNLRGNRSNYRYQVPNGWQGRFATLRVVGDKAGGWATQLLRKHPDLLQRIRDTAGVPVRLVHVVRNPYDNIAAIARWHRMSHGESIEFYFSHCETTSPLAERDNVITVRHETLIRAPKETLSGICEHLGLAVDEHYLAECASIVFERPTGSRRRVEWTPAQVAGVDRRARAFAFLDGYEFGSADKADEDVAAQAMVPAGRADAPTQETRYFERIGAWLSPRVRSASPRE